MLSHGYWALVGAQWAPNNTNILKNVTFSITLCLDPVSRPYIEVIFYYFN